MNRVTTLITLLGVFVLVFVPDLPDVHADERSELKQRFKDRYKTLVALKDAGKIGEMGNGLVDAVESRYLTEVARTKPTKVTVGDLIAAENKDRERLYELIAAETKATPEDVAVRNARRHFERARPNHFFKRKDGKWVRKRDIDKK